MARDLATVAEEYEGRFLAGLVDIDAQPAIAQAVQLQSVPFVFAVIDGRPQPLIQDVLTLDNLRTAINQVMQQLDHPGHHRTPPAAPGRPGPRRRGGGRRAAARPALRARPGRAGARGLRHGGGGVREAGQGQPRRRGGRRRARDGEGAQRTTGVDAAAARAAADASPDDVEAQTLAADLDLLEGDVDAAFARLVELVRRTAGDERNQAREHLLGLFAAVGNDDPRVLKGRQSLASALF